MTSEVFKLKGISEQVRNDYIRDAEERLEARVVQEVEEQARKEAEEKARILRVPTRIGFRWVINKDQASKETDKQSIWTLIRIKEGDKRSLGFTEKKGDRSPILLVF